MKEYTRETIINGGYIENDNQLKFAEELKLEYYNAKETNTVILFQRAINDYKTETRQQHNDMNDGITIDKFSFCTLLSNCNIFSLNAAEVLYDFLIETNYLYGEPYNIDYLINTFDEYESATKALQETYSHAYSRILEKHLTPESIEKECFNFFKKENLILCKYISNVKNNNRIILSIL